MTVNVRQYGQWRVLVDWVDWRLGKRILHANLSLLLWKFYGVLKIAPFIETQFEVSLSLSVFDVVRVFLRPPLRWNLKWRGGGGEGGTQQSFMHGGSEVQTLTLLYTIFDGKDTPFVFFP